MESEKYLLFLRRYFMGMNIALIFIGRNAQLELLQASLSALGTVYVLLRIYSVIVNPYKVGIGNEYKIFIPTIFQYRDDGNFTPLALLEVFTLFVFVDNILNFSRLSFGFNLTLRNFILIIGIFFILSIFCQVIGRIANRIIVRLNNRA